MKTWSTPVIPGERRNGWREKDCPLCGSGGSRKKLFCEGFFYVQCNTCGLVRMNPQPGQNELQSRYSGDYGAEYLHYETENESAFLRLQLLSLDDAGFFETGKELLLKSGADKTAPRVLDAGCATGALLGELKKRGWECYGAELSAPEAEYARKTRGVEIKTAALEDCGYESEYFDTVLASHIIEHVSDPATFARELFRVTKKGGRVYVTTPNIGGFQARLFGGKWRSAIFDHLYLFSKKTLKALFEKSGFAAEKLFTWGGLAQGTAPAPVKNIADRLAKKLNFGDVMMLRALKPAE